MSQNHEDDTDTPGIPNVEAWMEHAPGQTTYRLPERIEDHQVDEVVLLMDYLENHISRTRFQIFLRALTQAWPETVHTIRASLVWLDPDDPQSYMVYGWKGKLCGLPDARGNLRILNQQEQNFWEVLQNNSYTEDQGFVMMASEFFGDPQNPKPMTRERALALIDEIIPASARALMAQHHLNQTLAPTADARRSTGPRF